MKKLILLLLCIIISSSYSHSQTCDGHQLTLPPAVDPCPTGAYKLVFCDDFNGTTLNTNKWYTYWPNYGTNDDQSLFSRTHDDHDQPLEFMELQVYKDQNIVVSNGTVKLIAKDEPSVWWNVTKPYSSGYLQAKTPFKYGKVEARFKVPYGHGMWSAFWLWGRGHNEFTLDDEEQEIDIIEHCGGQPYDHNITYHYHNNTLGCPVASTPESYNGPNFATNFHTFTCEFCPQYIKIYMDGNLVRHETKWSDFNNAPVSCDQYMAQASYWMSNWTPTIAQSLILNLAINSSNAGSYCNHVVTSAPFPQSMVIDYVRVWQRNIQPGLTDLCATRDFIDLYDNICQGDQKTFSVTGGYGELNWSVSSNLEIVSIDENSVTVKAKPNINGQIGHIYLNETNSPCGTNWTIDKSIKIGLPAPPIITSLGCGNGYNIECQESFNYTWENNSGMGFPLLNGGAIGDPNANTILGYFANFIPTATNKYCIPYSITQTNGCGSTTSSGYIRNNCIPFNGPLTTLCERVIDPIDMEDFGSHLSVFPNPASGHVNINFSDHYNVLVRECKIYNMMRGSIVNELEAVESSNYITCSEWERGDYMIFLKIETGQTIARIITLQ